MSLGKVPNIQSSDPASNLQQGYTSKAIQDLGNSPISGGSIVSSISLSTGSNSVSHKLGKKLSGWFIVRQRGSASIYDEQDSNGTPSQTLSLNASASVVVDIFVF